MITFKEHLTEEKKIRTRRPVVLAFMRANPPHAGHEKVIKKVLKTAQDNKATHEIVLSGSMDSKKNPLSPEVKLQHVQKLFPMVNFSVATQLEPSFMHHVQRLHRAGHDHLIVIAGGDRNVEYKKLLKKYANQLPNFKKIQVFSAGKRDEDADDIRGMSSSKMREHARNGEDKEFSKGLPKNLDKEYIKKLYNDTRRGMGLKIE